MGYPRSRNLFASAALLSLIALSACSGAGSVTAVPNPLERSSEAAVAAWELQLHPIAQPAVADGVALVYAKSETGVKAHAVAVDSGKELWSRVVHPGISNLLISLKPSVTKTAAGASVATFLQAANAPENNFGIEWWTSAVAVDLKTGKELFRGEPALIDGRPDACEDGKDMCYVSFDAGTSESTSHRVDLGKGTLASGQDVIPLPGAFRKIGKGLYSVTEAEKETLHRIVDGKVLWSAGVTDIFGPDANTNMGFGFDYSEKLDLFVGSVGSYPAGERDIMKIVTDGYSHNVADFELRGIRASTGDVLWTVNSVDRNCSTGLGKSESVMEGGKALPVRCEYSQGTWSYPSLEYKNAVAQVVGYDPATGEAVWKSEAMKFTKAEQLVIPSISRGDFMLVGSAGGVKLTNTIDGASRVLTPEDVLLCTATAEYPVPANPPFRSAKPGGLGTGGKTIFPCGADGKAAAGFTAGAIQDVDTTDSGFAVVGMSDRIVAFPLP